MAAAEPATNDDTNIPMTSLSSHVRWVVREALRGVVPEKAAVTVPEEACKASKQEAPKPCYTWTEGEKQIRYLGAGDTQAQAALTLDEGDGGELVARVGPGRLPRDVVGKEAVLGLLVCQLLPLLQCQHSSKEGEGAWTDRQTDNRRQTGSARERQGETEVESAPLAAGSVCGCSGAAAMPCRRPPGPRPARARPCARYSQGVPVPTD